MTQTIESNKIDNQDKANIQEDQVSQLDEEDDKNSSAEKEVEAQASNLDGKNIEPKDISDNLPTADKDNLIDLRRDETQLVKQEVEILLDTKLDTSVNLENLKGNQVETTINLDCPVEEEVEPATNTETPVDIELKQTVNLEYPVDREVDQATKLETPVDKEVEAARNFDNPLDIKVEPTIDLENPIDKEVELATNLEIQLEPASNQDTPLETTTNPEDPSDNKEEITTLDSPGVDKQLDGGESPIEDVNNEAKEMLEDKTEITTDDISESEAKVSPEAGENDTEEETGDRAVDPINLSTMEKHDENGGTENGEIECNTEENRMFEDDGHAVETSNACILGSVSEASNLEYKESLEEEDLEEKAEEEEEKEGISSNE